MKALKYLLLCALGCFVAVLSYANHITGGQMYYTLVSESGGSYTYKVTMMLYRDCYSQGAQLDDSAPIGVYNNETGALRMFQVPMARQDKLQITSPDPCILNPPTVCYDVGYYEFSVTLPASSQGYTIAYQRCCRIAGINNLIGSSNVGATYTAQIPGTALSIDHPKNNSAQFVGEDRVVVCANSPISYSFAAKDADAGDELRYYFCEAYVGGGQGQNPQGGPNTPSPNPPSEPPYKSVPYNSPYSASKPLGDKVSINPTTGMISGIAPGAGIYVVTVCVDEYRNGKKIATQRKDLQIKIAACQRAEAVLNPEYVTCDGLTRTFRNEVPTNSLIKTYYWDFGVAGTDADVSTDASPTFTYPAPGTYTLTLITNKGLECSDEATAVVKVYPGFFPDFTFAGICVNKPTQFTDKTTTNFGVVDSWKWDFGDAGTADASTAQNPAWTYASMGKKNVRFIVTNSMGCIDTVFKEVEIIDKPPIKVLSKDTLLCVGDSVTLAAEGSGVFSWTPADRMINGNTATPTVFPTATTTYTVELNDNGCINRETARVRVVSEVTLRARPDTTICLTDSVQLSAVSDGLRFTWTPSQTVKNPTLLNPRAKPSGTTTYQITARIGRCTATDDVVVTTAPYPLVNAGPDTTICHETPAQLAGSHDGTTFTWTPTETLSGATTLTPIASPLETTAYVLTARNEQSGCPKPVSDTVVVQVLPDILAFAGRDTAVVVGQPLQFKASGGVRYEWSPAYSLSATDIADPVAVYSAEDENIRYTVLVYNEQNCVDSASVTVRVFKTEPQVFVPTGFTPNGDGQNDVVRPIAVGMTRIELFRIYNRWGQLVFSTTVNGKGWDGRINGKEQGTGVYVWIVQGTDFTGKVVSAKGTVTLIR